MAQTAILAQITKGSAGEEGATSTVLGGALGLKVTKEHDDYGKKLVEDPEMLIEEYWKEIRAECGAMPGKPLTAQRYGERTLGKYWEGHQTLQRIWMMLASIWLAYHTGHPKEAQARTVQCLKATAKATLAKGQWAAAWGLTHLPELNEDRGGVSLDEEAALGKKLREQAAIQKIIAESATGKKKDGEK